MGIRGITINGIPYQIDSTYSTIKTNYPVFDTISLGTGDEWKEMKIICNFKPDSSYTLVFACCGSTDIVPSWKANYDSLDIWDFEVDFSKIQSFLLDRPQISVKLKNGSTKDTIYGWCADYACFPNIVRITKSPFLYGTPPKCYYWTNINRFEIFKTKKNLIQFANENGYIEDQFPPENRTHFETIYFRLFDNGNYTISYDLKSKKAILSSD